MAQQIKMSATAIELEFEEAAPDASHGGAPVVDRFGMPLTPNAARMMPVATLQAAMSKALAHLKRTTPAELLKGGAGSADGTSALDSIEVIWLLAKMKRAFGHSVLDLSNVPRSQWSTLGAVSALVHDAIAEMP